MKVLPLLLGAIGVLVVAQDTKTVLFPPSGNGSSLEIGGDKVEPIAQPDMTRGTVLRAAFVPPHPQPQPQPMLPSDYFFPVPQRTFPHHRSEVVPYAYEYSNVGYPVAHSLEHSIVPSKQLVIVSFIGLLLLLAIIQNTLSAVKRKDAIMDLLSSRQKRDVVYPIHEFRSVTPVEEEILNSDARVRCIQRTICLENRKLFRDLGAPGALLAKYLTKDIEKSLKSGWDRLVRDAGAAGIRGEDCNVLYRDCEIPVTRKMHKISDNKK